MNTVPRSRIVIFILICILLNMLLFTTASPTYAAISGQQATNDGTYVYYQYSYTGTPTYWHIYIDTDQSASTGYKVQGIGANYMLENSTLFQYTGSGTTWSWSAVKSVTYSNSTGLAKWTVARSDIGDTACPNADNLVFETANKSGSTLDITGVYAHNFSGCGGATNTPTKTPAPATNTPTFTPLPATNTPIPTFQPPTNTPGGTIYNQQASNDGTNVYYRFNYTGTFSWYRVYVDTDQNSTTGYVANRIGADYLLENANLYRYSGTGGAWGWTLLKTVTYTNANNLASWTVARSDIGETATPNTADLIFQVESPLTSSPKYTHVYSGSATATPTGSSPTATPTTASGGTTTVSYTASTAVITNPERGFDHTNTACDSSLYSQSTLQGYRTNENISLVLCNFYLTSFKTSAISQAALNTLQTQLNTIRAAGLKVVLRFAYTSTDNVDASLTQILSHIDQLAPIIQSNSDVILVWQAGFIGEWGEWYYTNHFGDQGVISAQQWADRKSVVDKMLSVLPSTRMVSLRTPNFKRTMYQTAAITSSQAFNGSAIARIGQHNDAFVASPDDMGTYTNTSVEYPWLQAETTYLPMGGENDAYDPPRADCPTALQEMGMFHWTYINTDYYQPTLSAWTSQGCIDTMKKQLGYRFVLSSGTYPNSASVGGPLNVQINMRNDGFAAPFNPRNVELVLRNTSSGALYRFALASDPRLWLAGTTTTITQTITLPTNIPTGTYALLLNLPDPMSALNTRPEYSIQLANVNTWEASTGFNNLLRTVTIQ